MKYLLGFLDEREPLARYPLTNEQRGIFLGSLIRLMNVKARVLEECDSSHSEIMLLYISLDHFAEHGEHVTVAQAAKLIRVSAPSVSRTLKNLEEKGLIEREFDKNDRRSVRIVVTEAGEQRVNHVLNYVFTTMDRALGEFTDEELISMVVLQKKLVNSIEKATHERGN